MARFAAPSDCTRRGLAARLAGLALVAALASSFSLGCGIGSNAGGADPYGCFESWPTCVFDSQCPAVEGNPSAKVTCDNFKCTPSPAPTCGAGCVRDTDCGPGRVCLNPAAEGICVNAPPDFLMIPDLEGPDFAAPHDLAHHDL